MRKILILANVFCVFLCSEAMAQSASLNKAKYITTLKVVSTYKLKDKDLIDDVDKLRENNKFNSDLRKMLEKLDNNRPNTARNQRIMRILEKAGMDVYNELR